MKKQIVCFLLFLTIGNSVLAAGYSNYYCEKTFSVVKVGDSMEAIKAACGEPTNISTQEQTVPNTTSAVKWVYNLGMFTIKGVVFNLPMINLTFREQKVVDVNRNGLPVTAGYCAINGLVTLGDTMDKVLLNCGQPNFTTTAELQNSTSKTITQWTYNFGPYRPQIIFNFDNEKVIQISNGQLGK